VGKIREVLGSGTVEVDTQARLTRLLESIEEDAEVIASAEGRIARIVSSLKSFAPLDGKESKRRFDVHDGLENALTLLRYEVPDGVRVLRDFGTVAPILCYPAEINQVFIHLLTNAVNAIDGPGTILVRTFQSDEEVYVQITDSGCGVSPERLPRLFDPVFSSKGARVKAGLGLFTSANIVDKHGGDIRVESEPGKGTTFTVVLPAAEQSY
jgi:signal transduction histidine kinase